MDAVKDNAMIMLSELKSGMLKRKDMTPAMRQVCVAFLDDEGFKNEEIANTLQVSTRTIEDDLRAIRESYGNLITTIDYKMVLAMYLRDAAHYKKKAVREKDYRLAWQIDNDLIDRLMALGFLKKAPDELIVKTQRAEELTADEAKVIDEILMRVAERRNRKENEGLLGGGKNWLTGGDDGWNGSEIKGNEDEDKIIGN